MNFSNPKRITELFGIEYPLIQAGMVWCSGWRLASAVSNAGGLGLIGSGSMTPEILREHLIKCKQNTNKPFGVNLPLRYKNTEENIKVLLNEGVKIVFSSAGNPDLYTKSLKDNGVTVVHVIANSRFAVKAEAAGVNAIVAEGFEAGGHNGKEETTTLCLIPQIREITKLPLIAAGGIGSGKSMLAAMMLGADAVQIGTAFAACEESSAHINYKRALVESTDGDTILSLKKLSPVRIFKNEFFKKIKEAEEKGANIDELRNILGFGKSRLGIFDGEVREGEVEFGQVAANISSIKSAAKIVEEIIEEYNLCLARIKELSM